MMAPSPDITAEPWLESPLRTDIGSLQLAGVLRNIEGIDQRSMRILGSYALVLMVEGRGYYCDARGTKDDLQPGDVVLVFPDLAHAYGPVADGRWTQIYFVFGGPQFDLWRRRGMIRPDRPVLRLGAPDYWRQRLADVVARDPKEMGRAGAALRTLGRLTDVMAEMLAAATEAERAPGRDAWYEQSLRLLGQPSDKGWPAPQVVAREVGLSYENFRKRFAQFAGESPGQYQKRRRLERACAAIYQGQRSIKEIADELGFCDVFHFSKAFKQVIGVTPSDYRRRVSGG